MRRRGGRKRAIGTRAPMLVPMMPNDRWSLDYVADQLTDGRRFHILTAVDDCTREGLALLADTSLSGIRVAQVLDRLRIERSKPRMVVSDNGSELTNWQRHSGMGRPRPSRIAIPFRWRHRRVPQLGDVTYQSCLICIVICPARD